MLVAKQVVSVGRRLVLGDHVLQTICLLQLAERKTGDAVFAALLLTKLSAIPLQPNAVALLQIYVYRHMLLVLSYF